MIQSLMNLLGLGPQADYKQLVESGATIVDVRTKGEYESGHIKGSVNIPLGSLPNSYSRIRKDRPVITCCASGMRSGQAKSFLKSHGFTEVHNGGGWSSLEQRLK